MKNDPAGEDDAAVERACERVLLEFFRRIDFGEATRVADLFTPDGVWRTPLRTTVGREEIRQAFRERENRSDRRSMHVLTNVLVTRTGPENAEAVSYFHLFRRDGAEAGRPAPLPPPVTMGDYHDRFVRTTEGWLLAERTTNVRFYRPEDSE